MNLDRRQALTGALGLVGAASLGGIAKAAGLPFLPARSLSLHNLHTGEALKATFFENGAYVPDALAAFNHLLRDFRTGDAHAMEPGLLDLVSTLSAKVGAAAQVQVISGYRSPKTNAALHAHSEGVASHSLHMEGKAMDIRVPGVELSRLRDTALILQRGGVGFY